MTSRGELSGYGEWLRRLAIGGAGSRMQQLSPVRSPNNVCEEKGNWRIEVPAVGVSDADGNTCTIEIEMWRARRQLRLRGQ